MLSIFIPYLYKWSIAYIIFMVRSVTNHGPQTWVSACDASKRSATSPRTDLKRWIAMVINFGTIPWLIWENTMIWSLIWENIPFFKSWYNIMYVLNDGLSWISWIYEYYEYKQYMDMVELNHGMLILVSGCHNDVIRDDWEIVSDLMNTWQHDDNM